METIVEEMEENMDAHHLSQLTTESVLSTSGGYVFTIDAASALTANGNGATYVTLPLHLLQDSGSLEGGAVSLFLDGNQITLLGGSQVMHTSGLDDGEGQLILDVSGGDDDEKATAMQELDMSALELSALPANKGDVDVVVEPSEERQVEPLKEAQVNVPRRGPGRPRKDETDSVDPPIGKGPFKCTLCLKEFTAWSQMKKHSKIHLEDKPHCCPKCPASFNIQSNLVLHIATHATENPQCPECLKTFSRVASLKAHVTLHQQEESLFCSECGDEYATQAQLDQHKREHQEEWIKSSTTSAVAHQCRKCHRQFARASAFREHMREHYRVRASLHHKSHKRNIDRTSFTHKCEACNKYFQKPSQLVRHHRIHTGERPYECNLCCKRFNQKGSLQIHMAKHNGSKPHSCEFCPALFSQKGNLRAHIARVHAIPGSGEEVYKCVECTCVFKKLGSLNSHISRIHSGGGDPKTANNASMDMAVNVSAALAELASLGSTGAQRQQDEDDILQQALANSGLGTDPPPHDLATARRGRRQPASPNLTLVQDQTLDGYVRRFSIRSRTVNKVRWLECSYCSKEFKKPSDVVRHIRIHTHERPYKCSHCFRSFTVKSTLVSHEKTHTGTKEYTCATCNKQFTTMSSLRVHERIHTGSKPFPCSSCDRRFRTTGHLRSHMAIAHRPGRVGRAAPRGGRRAVTAAETAALLQEPMLVTETGLVQLCRRPQPYLHGDATSADRPHKCCICSLAFRKSSHLQQHIRKHTGERPFKCTLCNKSFLTNGILKTHMRAHAGVKPFRCTLCDYVFSTNGSLKRHMGTHSDARPFMCPYCQKTFKSTVNTRKHMKTHVAELQFQQEQAMVEAKQADDGKQGEGLLPGALGETFTAPDFTQAFSDQPFHVEDTGQMASSADAFTDTSLPIDTLENSAGVMTHTLHADASGMITLPDVGAGSLTQENIREIERTLNEQIFGGTAVVGESDVESTASQELLEGPPKPPKPPEQLYEALGFDFTNIAMQDGVITLDDPELTSSMACLLARQEPSIVQTEPDINPCDSYSEDEGGEAEGDEAQRKKDNEARPYICPICNFSFKKISHQKAHMNTHTRVKPYSCDICGKKLCSASSKRLHMKTHAKQKDFTCAVCACAFTTNGSLVRHMEVHSNKRPFKCCICASLFRTDTELRSHIKLHVPREKAGQVVAAKAAVPVSRSRRRASVIRLTAEETEMIAKQSMLEAASVSEEVLIASAAEANRISEIKDRDDMYNLEPLHPNQCKYCPKSFRKPSDLVRHVRTHTGERPYRCHSCGKGFAVKSTLDSHLKTHVGEKCFKCHVCNSIFSTKGSLKVHMRLHTGAKPFKCPQCEQQFRTSGHRKAHMSMHLRQASKKPVQRKTDAQSPERTDDAVNNLDEFVDMEGFHTLATEEAGARNFQLELQMESSVQPMQIDEALLQQLQTSNIIIQSQASDLNGASVFNTGDAQGNVRFEIHTDEHGQIINIQPMQDDVLFNLNEDFALTTEEETPAVTKKKVLPNKRRKKASDKEPSLNQCSKCQKIFEKPSQLQRHELIHTGEKPFQCKVCQRAFNQKNSLKIHMRSHTGHRPHNCILCDYSSTQRGNLRTHIKKVHGVDGNLSDSEFYNPAKSLFKCRDIDPEVMVRLDLENMDEELFPHEEDM